MRKIPFWLVLLVIVGLGAMRPQTALWLVLLSAGGLFAWFAIPIFRQSYAAVGEGPYGPRGELARIAAAISNAFHQWRQMRLEEHRRKNAELEQARSGVLTPINPGAVVLRPGEEAFASISASMLELRTVGYKGRSTGVSVRVARGVWLRESGSRGVPEKGLVPIAHGVLVATNQRLIFAGDQDSLAIPFQKISSFETMSDGLRLGDGHKTYNFFMGRSRQQQIFSIIANRLVHERASA